MQAPVCFPRCRYLWCWSKSSTQVAHVQRKARTLEPRPKSINWPKSIGTSTRRLDEIEQKAQDQKTPLLVRKDELKALFLDRVRNYGSPHAEKSKNPLWPEHRVERAEPGSQETPYTTALFSLYDNPGPFHFVEPIAGMENVLGGQVYVDRQGVEWQMQVQALLPIDPDTDLPCTVPGKCNGSFGMATRIVWNLFWNQPVPVPTGPLSPFGAPDTSLLYYNS